MRVIVTGSSGRIGRAVCARLAREHRVIGLDRRPSPTTQVLGDIGDARLLECALQGVGAVVHTAALHAPQVGQFSDAAFERTNIVATQRLAEAAASAGATRFVFTSTTALYGVASTQDNADRWTDEAVTPRPQTIYHRTKLAAETLLETIAARGPMTVTVLRMSRCFPEPAPLMAVYRLHRGVDARDVADAHALALLPTATPFRRFVISGATPFLPEDVPALLRDAPAVLARRAPTLVEEFLRRGWRLPRSIDRVYVPALALHGLRWQPRFGFDEVLRQFDEASPEVLAPADEPLSCE